MSKQVLPTNFTESVELTIPEFGTRSEVRLVCTKIREGETRIIEAKAVNGATYNELEYVFNEGYREAKANLTMVRYEIAQSQKIQRRIKSECLLDQYPEFIKNRGINDNASNREAFLELNEDYIAAQDRIDMLVAMEEMFENKIKVFENVCRYMKKEMDILIRSGMSGNKFTGK